MQSNFNEKQKEAISLGFGPAMILAGPGSGKTKTLLHRIEYLTNELNISPQHILVITFTKAAALELKERANKILKFSKESPFYGTFHSYFYSVLKQSYEYQNFSIISLKTKKQNLEQLLKLKYPKMRISNNLLMDVLSCISKQKNQVSCLKDIENLGFTEEEFLKLNREYTNFNYDNDLMDYDDIMLLSLKLLKSNKSALNILQKQIKYVLVDEFQDVNSIQYDLIRMLTSKRKNIFVVGDDDQSIYKFRGAKEENFRRFERDFYPVKKVVLDINYRCPKKVVAISSKLISCNQKRYFKQLTAGKETEGNVYAKSFFSKHEEINFIVDLIKTHKKEESISEMVVLCRTNSQLSYFSERLKKENIAFYMKEKPVSFYEKTWIKPIIGYGMFASGVDKSRKRLFTFMNVPMRYIKRENFADCFEGELNLKMDKITDVVQKAQMLKLDEILNCIGKQKPLVAINYILKVVGYEAYAMQKFNSIENLKEWKESIKELKERARMYSSLREWMEFVKWEEEFETITNYSMKIQEPIKLYTFHGAKGLEFPNVIIPHLNEGSVPYGKNLKEEELEEERRMFYVALTRCSENLWITCVENDTKKDTVSRFIKECALTVSK